jgi:hypothetical protein
VSIRRFLTALAVPLLGVAVLPAQAADRPVKEVAAFGVLRSASAEQARADALAWLKSTGKGDAACVKAFDAIWAQFDRPVIDRVAETLALGDAEAAKLLAEARDPAWPAPTTVPALLKDKKRPAFFRINLTLAYARALSQRRVYEESLDALRLVRPEQVLDPAAYLFHRAVAEHALLLKDDANRSIVRLLDDVADAPERYKMVSVLMAFDMRAWKEKDLGAIARRMDNVERRLELARGGPRTQKIQKEVVARLDELIKQLENQAKGQDSSNGGACPDGGQPGGSSGGAPNSPQRESKGGKNSGPGKVDPKHLENLARQWGKLPDKQRAEAMQELTRDMPPRYREVIESYFRKLATSEANRP